MKYPKVILTRHGYTAGNAGKQTHGMSDVRLVNEGHRQAELLSEHIVDRYGAARIGHIVTTPYIRTHETAAPLLTRTGRTPIVMPDLREITYLQPSRADGKTYEQRAAMRQEFWEATRQNPNYTDPGEQPVDSAGSFLRRIHAALGILAALAAHDPGITVAYAHEFSISAAVNMVRGIPDSEILANMIEYQKPAPAIRNTQAVGLGLESGRLILAHESDFDLFPEVH